MSRRKRKLPEARGFGSSSVPDSRQKPSKNSPAPESAPEKAIAASELDAVNATELEPEAAPKPETDASVELPADEPLAESAPEAIAAESEPEIAPEPTLESTPEADIVSEPPLDVLASEPDIVSEPTPEAIAPQELPEVSDSIAAQPLEENVEAMDVATESDRDISDTSDVEPEAEAALADDQQDAPTTPAETPEVEPEPETETVLETSDRDISDTVEPETETSEPEAEAETEMSDRDPGNNLEPEPQEADSETVVAAEVSDTPELSLAEAPVTHDLWEAPTQPSESITPTDEEPLINAAISVESDVVEAVNAEPNLPSEETTETAIASNDVEPDPTVTPEPANEPISEPATKEPTTSSSASEITPAQAMQTPAAIALVAFAFVAALWQTYATWMQGTLPSGALSGRKLARRLGVSSSTIQRRKNQADFSTWTQSLDSEGITWVYEQGIFVPHQHP